ncbi:MAG: 30S ribosomal protein S12 methylthiotransferase RimO [Firmicutes bacterium]|jgi:ribosomal protein S12 methylthiotransferase|nr:30S ribosomal protein S12 methylthiotransferase RimO [Bacillota bacterium]
MEPIRVGFVSLGCAKNLVDTEVALGMLAQEGFAITFREEEADVLVVNTCTFIEAARKESFQTISELAENKKDKCRALIVAGCLAQRYGEALLTDLPAVDALLGTGEIHRLPQAIRQVLGGAKVAWVGEPTALYDHRLPRLTTGAGHSVYVKIAEGCHRHCTYCVIPQVRGKLRSRSVGSILEETRRLVAQGAREVILIAQDTTAYGLDRYGRPMLAELLRKVAQVEGLAWVRFLYTYPTSFTPDLIRVLAEEEKVCRYVDLPLQHINETILKRMGRRGSKESILRLIKTLRQIPGIVLRTTFIVGFPGETEAQFEELLRFMEYVEFDHVGVFTYSQEEGTPAGRLGGQLSQELKEERRARAMELQARISRRRNRARLGGNVEVLIEGRRAGGSWGRTRGQAPDVDGITHLPGVQLEPGRLIKARVVGAGTYDLYAAPLARD